MSEPLTKDKISKECDETCTEDTEIVHLKDLKSALEEFERLIGNSEKGTYISTMAMLEVRTALMKAFPAIYEKEKGDE